MQKSLPGDIYGLANLGGKVSWYDLKKEGAYKILEGNILHEIVHNMGYNEFGAWSAMLAAGYISKDIMKDYLTKATITKLSGKKVSAYKYILTGNEDLKEDFEKGKISAENIIEEMTDYGNKIIGK